jgi:hypothetical protein
MRSGSKFLAGCGIGAVAAFMGTTLLSRKPGRDTRSRAGSLAAPTHKPIQSDRVSRNDEPDEPSTPNPGSLLSLVECCARPHGELASSSAKALLWSGSFANAPKAFRPSNAEPSWQRHANVTQWVTAVTAIVAAVAAMAAICFVLGLQRQIRKLSAERIGLSEAKMLALQEDIRTAQRAWVGLADASAQPLTDNGGRFTIRLQNTGRTPALDLQIAGTVRVVGMDEPSELPELTTSVRNSAGTLIPGAVYTTDVWFQTSADAISGLARDQVRAVTFLRVTYKDVFLGPHETRVCFYWSPSMPAVQSCDRYNELN